ncbi:hypothetical protein D5S17_10325 [Pseudonocardiaceae bacterium YIM PH 21723]|nr:hypothetical protein D5S17_10325 [Pseudonocardiaceae bacterium YIM PH 21723]
MFAYLVLLAAENFVWPRKDLRTLGVPLDDRFGFSVSGARTYLDQLGADGQRLFAIAQVVDLVVAVVLVIAALELYGWLAVKAKVPSPALRFGLPVALGLVELLENGLLLLITLAGSESGELLLDLASAVGMLKIMIYLLAGAILLGLIGRILFQKRTVTPRQPTAAAAPVRRTWLPPEPAPVPVPVPAVQPPGSDLLTDRLHRAAAEPSTPPAPVAPEPEPRPVVATVSAPTPIDATRPPVLIKDIGFPEATPKTWLADEEAPVEPATTAPTFNPAPADLPEEQSGTVSMESAKGADSMETAADEELDELSETDRLRLQQLERENRDLREQVDYLQKFSAYLMKQNQEPQRTSS